MLETKEVFFVAACAVFSFSAAAATGCAEFSVLRPRGDGTPVVKAADFGFSRTNDFNAAAINRAIEHCRRTGAHTLELDEGQYNCFDAPHGIALTNMTDFTFDGRGAVLVFRRPAEFRCQPQSELVHENASILVKNCERTLVCDFKMDWDWERDPLACFCRCTDVHVDASSENASYADLLFTDFDRHPKYPAPVPVQKLQCMDESREAFANGPQWAFGFSEGHWGTKSEWIAPNRLRIYPCVRPGADKPFNPAYGKFFSAGQNVAAAKRFEKGRLYRLQHYYYGKNGINLVSNRHLRLQDIDIWSCFGMGIVVDGRQEYWQVENVRIEPRPDAPYKRPASSVSDAYHVARSRGHAKHINMRIRLNNDDSFNFHDRFAIAERAGVRSLKVTMARGIGYFRPEPGDRFELRTPDWRATGFYARFVRAEGETMILDRDIPESLQGAFFVFDREYGTDNIILRNCTIDNAAHRNLFSSSNLTIEDCLFNRTRSFPVRIIADARTLTWCEGLGETNILVRNNVFLEPSCGSRSNPVFSTVMMKQVPWKTGPDDPGFMRDIAFEKNLVVDPYGPALRLESGSGISFSDNEIRFTRAPFSSESGAILNVGATDVRIERNRVVTNGAPVSIAAAREHIRSASLAPKYGGIYDKEDPPPADRAKALAELAAMRPPRIAIQRRVGRNVLLVDGRPTPVNQYKGFADYRATGECGGNMVITFNRGQRLFKEASFDKADLDPKTGSFDFSRIEDTLLRIHAANPKALVLVNVDLDPDNAFLERNPESIFLNEKGIRGRSNFQAFGGFDSTPLDPRDKRVGWAYSYTSEPWRKYVEAALAKLCAYLKSTPAANIVIGFHLSGGMDGQFVQWQYGPENGHFDYSEENRRALCRYLREIYGTDEALQAAWGDRTVTLDTARNPSVAEFKSASVFDDRPGPGRRLADCRRFVAIGPARALNGFARTLKREFGRPCLVETWYTSTIWSQPGRLAVDELVKDGGVDVICTVSGYSNLRAIDGIGASANNSIAGLNLRGLLFVQEMDHRTWRTQHTGGFMSAKSVAMPADEREFAIQLRRDAGSVIAAGGSGFHLFDMFGSWYHGSKVKPAMREIYAMNSFATAHAGEYEPPQVAIFTDEKARLLRDSTPETVNRAWRTSGVMPAIHYLTDIENEELPDYRLYIAYSPLTLTAAQAQAFRRRCEAQGKKLVVVGAVALASRDFTGAEQAIAAMKPRGGRFLRLGNERDLTPEALNSWARDAGVMPYAEPGNATYVGNGVAVVHRLKGPARIDFGREVTLVDPVTGRVRGNSRFWEPSVGVGESAATCYLDSGRPLFKGLKAPPDPPPADRTKALSEMASIPPATAEVRKEGGSAALYVDGRKTAFNAYKGEYDYRLMGEAGGNIVLSFNSGSRLYASVNWDKALWDEKSGTFDFTRIEDNLLRIHEANPRARVILSIEVSPDRAFLEANPDEIFVNDRGERGLVHLHGFRGYGVKPLSDNPIDSFAYSYTGDAWRGYVERGLVALVEWLKRSPAGNIVMGFSFSGGMDGQFVQWEYKPVHGHFDYSEANRRALCRYLRELYGTDAALQAAWGDGSVTLATAANPTPREFASRTYFDDRPGFGRRLADCRRFISVGTARALNGFAQTVKKAWGRPAVVELWWTTAIWCQPSRLALDELVKGGAVDILATVSYYGSNRAVGGLGASANNTVASINGRGLLYVQELDHRTRRTQHVSRAAVKAHAIALTAEDYNVQIMRDVSSVIAVGGQGFYFFDMFGSWFHDAAAAATIRKAFAMNSHATRHAGEFERPSAAFVFDEKTRLLAERVAYDTPNAVWRTSGTTPAMHLLSDVGEGFPEYRLCILWNPVSITKAQVECLRRRVSDGMMLVVAGETGICSRDFASQQEALAALGPGVVRIADVKEITSEALNSLARKANARVYAEPGNVTYVGNGVACVHRIAGPAAVDFGREVTPVDPVTGEKGAPLRHWKPDIPQNGIATLCYLP